LKESQRELREGRRGARRRTEVEEEEGEDVGDDFAWG
jgi:hypothetical protein